MCFHYTSPNRQNEFGAVRRQVRWVVTRWGTREASGVWAKSVPLGVGTGYMDMFPLLNFIELYNCDLYKFLYAGYTSKKFIKNALLKKQSLTN